MVMVMMMVMMIMLIMIMIMMMHIQFCMYGGMYSYFLIMIHRISSLHDSKIMICTWLIEYFSLKCVRLIENDDPVIVMIY